MEESVNLTKPSDYIATEPFKLKDTDNRQAIRIVLRRTFGYSPHHIYIVKERGQNSTFRVLAPKMALDDTQLANLVSKKPSRVEILTAHLRGLINKLRVHAPVPQPNTT